MDSIVPKVTVRQITLSKESEGVSWYRASSDKDNADSESSSMLLHWIIRPIKEAGGGRQVWWKEREKWKRDMSKAMGIGRERWNAAVVRIGMRKLR